MQSHNREPNAPVTRTQPNGLQSAFANNKFDLSILHGKCMTAKLWYKPVQQQQLNQQRYKLNPKLHLVIGSQLEFYFQL